MKVKIFCENIHPLIIKYFFWGYVCPKWIFIFDTEQVQINSVHHYMEQDWGKDRQGEGSWGGGGCVALKGAGLSMTSARPG